MEKTSVFNKDVSPKLFDTMCFENDCRSKRDGLIGSALGYQLNETKSDKYLKRFLDDFKLINSEHRIKYAAVWDFETTDTFNAYGVSLAIMVYDIESEEVVEQFYELINPLEKISTGAYRIHKISQEMVNSEKTFEEHLPEIERIFSTVDTFVGHNLAFDLGALEREYQRLGKVNPFTTVPVFDTMKAAKDILNLKDTNGKKIKSPKLEECLEYYGFDTDKEFHNAQVDVQETLNVFIQLLEEEF